MKGIQAPNLFYQSIHSSIYLYLPKALATRVSRARNEKGHRRGRGVVVPSSSKVSLVPSYHSHLAIESRNETSREYNNRYSND